MEANANPRSTLLIDEASRPSVQFFATAPAFRAARRLARGKQRGAGRPLFDVDRFLGPPARLMDRRAPVYFAIVHHPVLNRLGEVISAQVDNLDFFDACRLTLTYGIDGLFFTNPTPAQQDLLRRMIEHASSPSRDPDRGRFDRTHMAASLDEVVEYVARGHAGQPVVVGTSAAPGPREIGFAALRSRIQAQEQPVIVVVGKAWGLAPEVLETVDLRLEPIDAGTGYNHLSVRSALAIVFDRLLG